MGEGVEETPPAARDGAGAEVAALRARVAALESELAMARGELLRLEYVVSHDLRAPVRVISGFAQALLSDHGDGLVPDARHLAERIVANGVRMGQLIDGLLLLSRVSRSEMSVQPVDVAEMAREHFRRLVARKADRKVDLLVPETLVVEADPQLARIVLEQVLDNAWKAVAAAEGGRITIEPAGRAGGDGEGRFAIRDEGIGFDPRYAEKLYGVFQKLHRDDEFPGVGVGLAVVERILGRHGGFVHAESTPGGGARFEISFSPPEGPR